MTAIGQIPVRKAARFAPIPSREKPGTRFHQVEEIVAARSHARRAEIVLRTPDGLVAQMGRQLIDACIETGFGIGADYLVVRQAALNCLRTPEGLVREEIVRELEHWRVALVALSKGLVETPQPKGARRGRR